MGGAELPDAGVVVAQFVGIDVDHITQQFISGGPSQTAFAGTGLSPQDDGFGVIEGHLLQQLALWNHALLENTRMRSRIEAIFGRGHWNAPLFASKYAYNSLRSHKPSLLDRALNIRLSLASALAIASASPLDSAVCNSVRASSIKVSSAPSRAQIACSNIGVPRNGLAMSSFRSFCRVRTCSG